MTFRDPKETWDESHSESEDDEEVEDLLEKPKHVTLLEYSELDSIKEFDPINDRVDKLILDKVISESQTERRRVLLRASFKSPALVTSLNGDPGDYQEPNQQTREKQQPGNLRQKDGGSLIDDPGERLLWVVKHRVFTIFPLN